MMDLAVFLFIGSFGSRAVKTIDIRESYWDFERARQGS
jgi:hypothetical protein